MRVFVYLLFSVSVESSAADADNATYASVTKTRKKKGISLDMLLSYYLVSSTDHKKHVTQQLHCILQLANEC